MRQANLIKESDSPYSALMMAVSRPDGEKWGWFDFFQVNMVIVNHAYLINRIDKQLEAKAGSAVFTILDLTKGYHQLLLHPNLKPVPAFLTPNELYQWKLLPLGMKSAAVVF